ncbi:transposase, MuDR, MULE transposase domain protein [Tanacetum coccineum]
MQKGETGPCWSWWMSVLKECIGDHNNLLFISDKHPTIALIVHNEFPLSFHAVCCRHLMMNLSLKKKKTKGLFWKICKTYTPDEFTVNMNIMQAVQPDAYQKLCQAGTQRWSRAHCPLVRYNYMTSNSVESVNACSVIKLAETYCAMLQDWYFERQKLTGPWHVFIYNLSSNSWNSLENYHLPRVSIRIKRSCGQTAKWMVLFVTSWRMLFVIPSTNVVKLIGFTKDDDPIVEVDRGRMLHPLQVYDRTSQEFRNVGISVDGGSFFIGPYKESLILLNV